MFEIWNRRYTGSKYKLASWIRELIQKHCSGDSFFDVFAGTGVITAFEMEHFKKFVVNDFLFSNSVIYDAFFSKENYDLVKLKEMTDDWNFKLLEDVSGNFFSQNYGGKYFSPNDAKKIGYLRQNIEKFKETLSNKEYAILLASLIYSADRIANTVGHYDAYIQGETLKDKFNFDFIKPFTMQDKQIEIYREDANILAKKIECDVAYIDPPYNSRQYSRFYHVLETLVQWDNPKLTGVALKRPAENMSEYCRSGAREAFADLINSLNCKYIVVSYNNTYNSKSSSSKNKLDLEDIRLILQRKGNVDTYDTSHPFFNAGKTNLEDHREFLFICKVKKDANMQRSPFFFVGDKRKLMPQLNKLFPAYINNYYEPFCGGGSSFLNTVAKEYIVNDVNFYVIKLHELFLENALNNEKFFHEIFSMIENYGLSCSFKGKYVPAELKKKFVKTYYAEFNKIGYLHLRGDFNENQSDFLRLYLLLIYGFNHMIRFNDKSQFNLPVGNVDFNKNVADAIEGYFHFLKSSKIKFQNEDFKKFLSDQIFREGDFVYCDPPYLISDSEYNKLWDEVKEYELYMALDDLNRQGVNFGLTNLLRHKGQENGILLRWSEKYYCFPIRSNYISFNDNSVKSDTKEIYVTNVKS